MKIAGSDINIDHADIKGKNIQYLKKLDIFSHLSKEDQELAYAELFVQANLEVKLIVTKNDENTIELGIDTDAFGKSQEVVLRGLKDSYEAVKKDNGDKDK